MESPDFECERSEKGEKKDSEGVSGEDVRVMNKWRRVWRSVGRSEDVKVWRILERIR